jgi:hypothetical protein
MYTPWRQRVRDDMCVPSLDLQDLQRIHEDLVCHQQVPPANKTRSAEDASDLEKKRNLLVTDEKRH